MRVAASVGFGRLKLMPMVQSFMQIHPEVNIDLRLHDGFVDLVGQGIDVSVRIGELADSGLIARRVGTSNRVLMAHRDYCASLPSGLSLPETPHDLAQHNCVVYTEASTRNQWSFIAGNGANVDVGAVNSVKVKGRVQTNSSEVVRTAIISGMGIGYSPTWLFEPELASGEVVRLMPHWESAASPIHLVSPPERKHSAKVKALVEHITKAMAQ
jgi:DNA-binding transcriptional LysR family regulator